MFLQKILCRRRTNVFVRLLPRQTRTLAAKSNAARDTKDTTTINVVDPMDEVYGVYDFNTSQMRVAERETVPRDAFDEVRLPRTELLSLKEKKYQSLDPHDYTLDGSAFIPVSEQEYVIPSTGEAPSKHADTESVGKYFSLGKLNEGVSKDFEEEISSTENRLMMVREPAVRLISSLQAFKEGKFSDGPAPVTLLGGRRHTGKSATLAHVVDYARSNGWVTFFVPRMHKILNDSLMMEQSRRRPGLFDQPNFAVDILKDFQTGNPNILDEIQLKTKEHPAANGRLDNYDTLADLVGECENTDPAVDHVGLVLDLIRELGETTELPVLVALDDYNHCYQRTSYFYQSEPVEPEQLTIVNALRFFKKNDKQEVSFAPEYPLRNGVVVVAEAHHRPLRKTLQASYHSFWKNLHSCVDYLAHKRYSVEEMESCVRHYYHQKLCFQEPTVTAIRTMHLLTDGNPAEVMRNCANLSNFVTHVHLPGGQRGNRRNQWKHPR